MLSVSGGFILKCDRCGETREFGAEELVPTGSAVLENRPLGEYVEYGFRGSFACPCGNEMSAIFKGYEYPAGLHLSDESESRGCAVIEPPDIDDETVF